MESLTILWLTGDTTWDPSSLDVEDEEVLSPDEPGYGGVVNQLNAVSDFQKTLRGYNFVNYLLYTLGATADSIAHAFSGVQWSKEEESGSENDHEGLRTILTSIGMDSSRNGAENV